MARWWDELPVPSLAEVTAMNERLAEPRRRLEDVLRDAVTRWPSSTSHFPRLVEVASWPAQDIRSAALAYHAWACESGRHGSMVVTAVLRQLLTWAEGWDRHELLLALYAAANAVTITQDSNHLETPVAIAARTDPDEWRELRPILERLFDWLEPITICTWPDAVTF